MESKPKRRWSEDAKKKLKLKRLRARLKNAEVLSKKAPSKLGRQIGREVVESTQLQIDKIINDGK